jgi:hypothetical protein
MSALAGFRGAACRPATHRTATGPPAVATVGPAAPAPPSGLARRVPGDVWAGLIAGVSGDLASMT